MLTNFLSGFVLFRKKKPALQIMKKRTEDTMWDKKESLNYKKFIKK
jgi:hypothetical protein